MKGIENKASDDVKVITAKLEAEFEEKKDAMFKQKQTEVKVSALVTWIPMRHIANIMLL